MAEKKKATEKKGFFKRLMEKMDAKLEKKSKAKKCGCCSNDKSGKKKC